MTRVQLLICLLFALAQIGSPRAVRAQYMYLDVNGDGASTAADTLDVSSANTLTLYLNTNHDRDGSVQSCNSHTGAASEVSTINLFSYTVVLHASGGTVAWGTFESANTAYTALGSDLYDNSDAEFTRLRPAGSFSTPGSNTLGTITVSVLSGSPSIGIATSTPLDPYGFGTGFATSCDGSEFKNTYVLGTDWFDVDAVGAGSGSGQQMVAQVPNQLAVEVGQPSLVIGEFSSSYPGDSVRVEVGDLPPGLNAIPGDAFGHSRQMRLYGVIPSSAPQDTAFEIVWTASDPTRSTVAHTIMSPRQSTVPAAALEIKVQDFISQDYSTTQRHSAARSLGAQALPLLASVLRDSRYKSRWQTVARAIGDMGDTSYFDTLRSFVRDRFHGGIDGETVKAIRAAQGSLSLIATLSPRALDYLIASTQSGSWNNLAWNCSGWTQQSLSKVLTEGSLIALSYTDSDRARDIISAIPMPTDTTTITSRTQAIFVRGLYRVSADVRAHGILAAWGRTDPRLHGAHR